MLLPCPLEHGNVTALNIEIARLTRERDEDREFAAELERSNERLANSCVALERERDTALSRLAAAEAVVEVARRISRAIDHDGLRAALQAYDSSH